MESKQSEDVSVFSSIGFMGMYLQHHFGGRGGKYFILRKLADAGGVLETRRLVEMSGTSSASTSEVIEKLAKEGYVQRVRNAHDKRVTDVVLTEAGKVAADVVIKKQKEFSECAFSCLPEEDRHKFFQDIIRVADWWSTLDKKKEENACQK